jgi:hypothetical protein
MTKAQLEAVSEQLQLAELDNLLQVSLREDAGLADGTLELHVTDRWSRSYLRVDRQGLVVALPPATVVGGVPEASRVL